MSTTRAPSKIVLQAHSLLPSYDNPEATTGDTCVRPLTTLAAPSIVVGTGVHSTFQVQDDQEVDAAHGTLERTIGRGVWIYSDHSRRGSIVNGSKRLHRDAVVVHHGDTLEVGQTVIGLDLEMNTTTAACSTDEPVDRAMDNHVQPIPMHQKTALSARNVARMARRRASTPWGPAVAVHQTFGTTKPRTLQIETSGLDGNGCSSSSTAVELVRTPLEYTASPVACTRWCSKRSFVATATPVAAGASPSLSVDQYQHPPKDYQASKGVERISHVSSSSPRQMFKGSSAEKASRPPPLGYSSSPTVSPSALAARQRRNIEEQPSRRSVLPSPASDCTAVELPQPKNADVRPSSRRDNLRIQVSKKMAAAAPVSAKSINIPRHVPVPNLDFEAPASPVAQRDIIKQQESLQIILQHKIEEERLLKQQQEEWMRQYLTPVSTSDSELNYEAVSEPRIPLSPTKENDIVPGELARGAIPVLLLAETGLDQQRPAPVKTSPRRTGVVRSPQARLDGFQKRSNEPDVTKCCTPEALASSINRTNYLENSNCEIDCAVRSSDESVLSTATTTIACHRHVTSSLSSSCASSIGRCDFSGNEDEEETEDTVRSYPKSDMYEPAALPRRSREEPVLMFDLDRNSSIHSWRESN
ncbi:unnamed protein product [Hyaloperonospora brassicae]|uniref:FHA domain-containing protein n=1 Tax=Hyaloperonospora brassicae TaxID=162125 RepID=A0AAV0UMZ1_HYABA|nr:unnamed protein product [Hyaloperonospora brassicae]